MIILQKYMLIQTCPGCGYDGIGKSVGYSDDPKYCSGGFTLGSFCRRRYPHLHWKCDRCKCRFVSETKEAADTMKELQA